MTIDINCDMGERPDIDEAALMPWITSANVACGAHAGDEATMEHTIALAQHFGVSIGAHPGYPDRENFGREEMSMTGEELAAAVFEQVSKLSAVATRLGSFVSYVKPHGALYNVAAKRSEVAEAIAAGVGRFSSSLVLVGLAGYSMLDIWRAAGFQVAAEGFADRAYESDGSLRSRKLPGALLTSPEEAAAHALQLALTRQLDTLCIHSDTPGSAAIAREVRQAIEQRGIRVQAFIRARPSG